VEAFKISGDNKKVLNLTITILQKDMKSKDLKKNFCKQRNAQGTQFIRECVTMKNLSIKIDEIKSYFQNS